MATIRCPATITMACSSAFWALQLRPQAADEFIDCQGPKGTAVKLRDALNWIVSDPAAAHVYGQPYETADGVTVVPVARVRGRTKAGADTDLHLTARPVGVFVIKNGEATWVPA